MIPFPHDSYMRALAEAMYALFYLEGLIRHDLYRLSPPPENLDIWQISRSTMGALATRIGRQSDIELYPQKKAWLEACDAALEELTPIRNALMHSFPATIEGAQVLSRWAAPTAKHPQEAFPITEDFLDNLKGRVYSHIGNISVVRLPEPSPVAPSP